MTTTRDDGGRVNGTLQRAVASYRQGRLEDAKRHCDQALHWQPRNSIALNILGLIALQMNDSGRAVGLFEQAILMRPNDSAAHINLGNALRASKQPDAALRSYDRAIAIRPESIEAYNNRSVVLGELRQWTAALASCDQAIAIDRHCADAYYNKGNALRGLEQFDAALESYDRAIQIRPKHADAHLARGLVLKASNRLEAALHCCDQAIAIRSDFAAAFYHQGDMLLGLGQFERAAASYSRAIEIKDDFAEAHCNRGVALAGLKQLSAALASYDRAVAIKTDFAMAHFNRGKLLAELDQFESALANYDRAIALDPNNPNVYCNRGNILKDLNRLELALADYDRAAAIAPDFPQFRFNKAMALLLNGDFEDGWREFEWRSKSKAALPVVQLRHLSQPLWLGEESIEGKTVLLHSEQGLGDTIQFCRYATMFKSLGAKVILEVPRPLKELLGSLQNVAHIFSEGDALPDFDFQCPLMSLPLAFKTSLSTVPCCVPYLKCSPEKIRSWREKLGHKTKPRVGLVWSGGFRPDQPNLWALNNRRNIPLVRLAPLKNRHIEFFSLQKGQPAESELTELLAHGWDGPDLIDFTRELKDFSDTAALIENLDLVISVDTSTAHLAAALGKPVWILNRFDTCWRWLLNRHDSPWYPTVKLYRQESAGDWDGVVERVRNDLARLAAQAPAAAPEAQAESGIA
jgi:tetratricopeptide (TPR) repeat protein